MKGTKVLISGEGREEIGMKEIFRRYLVDEFAEDYEEGHLSRREALKLIAGVVGSLVAANAILAGCAPVEEAGSGATRTAGATAVATAGAAGTQAAGGGTPTGEASEATDGVASTEAASGGGSGQVEASDVQFEGEDGATVLGYMARPGGEGPFALILVCHENRGLTEHIKDVTRRLAQAGYAALAVDLLSRRGGTGALSQDEVPGILSNTESEQFVQDFRSGWNFMKAQPSIQGERVGMVGFCFGGGVTWLMATRMPELKAAAPFYGPHPPVEDVPNIQAAVLAIYAGRDQRINQGIPAIEAAMQENGKVYEKVIFPDTDHAFHNDTGSRYNEAAAKEAWARTLAWFGEWV